MADEINQWQRTKKILADAVELPLAERSEFVSQACEGDEELASSVHKLLGAHEEVNSFLEEPAGADSGLFSSFKALEPGSVLGPYTIDSTLGEGGFGIVYQANQSEPVKRSVALKVIKPGMDSHQIISRFAHERQALERMNHPNIARVLDAGTTPDARPYFVMELVTGEPISAYCSRKNLKVEDRVQLMVQVCAAVQHAHQKGVIHRDIKPSNVLVEAHTGKPLVKVIDFGIAKAVDSSQLEQTAFTRQGQMVGTPSYMSPEQSAGLVDIDTRTDVYSLGVLLYELVTGVCPFPSGMLVEAGLAEMQRIIQEVDPPKPSTRIVSEGDLAKPNDSVALSRRLRGDLDWIAMKALEKEPDRRYDSAAALSEDLERHLSNEPVLAGPPTASYRFSKFARRNRGALIASVFMVAALIGGLGLALYGLDQAQTERGLAEEAGNKEKFERERAQDALAQAKIDRDLAREAGEKETLEREKAQEALEREVIARSESDGAMTFLTQMLSSARPADQGKDVLVLDLLDITAPTLEQVENTQVESLLRYAIGTTYNALGRYDKAELHLTRGLELREEILGPEHNDTNATRNELTQTMMGKGDFDKARAYGEEALRNGMATGGLENFQTVKALQNLGQVASGQARYEDALDHYQKAVNGLDLYHPGDAQARYAIMSNMGLVYADLNQVDEALVHYNAALAGLTELLGPEHVNTMSVAANLVGLNFRAGNLDEAARRAKEILDWRVKSLGAEHPSSMQSLNNLGVIYMQKGDFAAAEPVMRETLRLRRLIDGEEHFAVVVAMANLGNALDGQEKYKEAVEVLRQAQATDKKVRGTEHPGYYITIFSLACSVSDATGFEDAKPLFEEALDGTLRLLGPDHEQTLRFARRIAGEFARADRHAEALQVLTKHLGLASLDSQSKMSLSYRRMIGVSQLAQNRPQEALETHRGVLGDARDGQGPESREVARAYEEIGVCLEKIEGSETSEMEAAYQEAWRLYAIIYGAEANSSKRVARRMLDYYRDAGRTQDTLIWEKRVNSVEEPTSD